MIQVCLFDIDGTLLNSGGAGQTAMEEAFAEQFHTEAFYEGLKTAGRTDWAIAKDLFDYHKHEMTEKTFNQFVSSYKEKLPAHLDRTEGTILPGVEEMIRSLHTREDIDLGLLTGNYRDGARLKLSHFDMHHYFEFGGFGDKQLHRDDVAKEALKLVHDRYTEEFDPDRIWVIGDTPADVQCGRAIGARVVAVATGIYSYDELKKTEPDFLYRDFSDSKHFISLLDNHTA